MKPHFVPPRLLFVAVLSILALVKSALAIAAVEVKPAANVDERLFLTYVLHDMYARCPSDVSDQQSLQKALRHWRLRANRVYEYVKDRNFDPKLTAAYADLLRYVDAYTTFLSDIGRVEREAVTREGEERVKSGTEAGFTGGTIAASEYYSKEVSAGNAAVAGLAAAAIQFLIDDAIKAHARDEAKRQAIESASQKLEAVQSSIRARLENAESDLATKYGWSKWEIRSADPPSETEALNETSKAGNLTAILEILDKKVARRPRDAQLLALRDSVATTDPKTSVSAMKESAEECAQRASLVPSGSIYDPYRAEILYSAADIANRAWTKEAVLAGKGWGSVKSPLAARAVELWDAVLTFEPIDDSGDCRERRAWALMASGRIEQAQRQADAVPDARKRTTRYALGYAGLMSVQGRPDEAFTWFERAVRELGFNNIAWAKVDPDLATMREAKATEFAELTEVKVTWDVRFGIFNDDIVLTNNSAFPITNLALNCHIESKGRAWDQDLKVDLVKPGETYKWVNVISIPGSQIDTKIATIACDQNRPLGR